MKYFVITLILLTFSTTLFADKFVVKSFKRIDNKILLNKDKRTDDNDELCGIVLVRTSLVGLGVSASTPVVGNVKRHEGDYWVYLSEGTQMIKFFKDGFETYEYKFPERIEKGRFYLLELEAVRPKPKIPVWPVTILTRPENASLIIDGKTVEHTTTPVELKEGKHTVIIRMAGYEKLEKTIEVNKKSVYFNFKLNETLNAALMIDSDPPGATVYLDGVKLGETPFSVFYPPGTYPVKVVKDGYVTLENQNLTVTAPKTYKKFTLEENVGYLTINTYQTAKVFINGTEYTEHANLKLPAQVLNIKVTMPKAADLEKQVVLKRNDNLSFDLYPKVQTGTIQVAVTPFDATIELTGDAGEHYTAQGMHIFRDIPVGQYTLTVKAKGYKSGDKTITLTAGQVLNENIKLEEGTSGDIEMVFVKGGTFEMGSNKGDGAEKPIHTVTVNSFYMSKYEVTQKQWRAIIGNNPSYFKGDDLPVENVSWYDVQEFIKKLNEKTGQHYRLPTEAEWEYAARGGNKSRGYKYAGSNNIDEVGWYWKNSGIEQLKGVWDWDKIKNNKCKTHPVGQKKPNELGIYDMSGNVWEWCSDWYKAKYYRHSPQNNPQGPESGSRRVYRGGSWDYLATYCRVAYRHYWFPDSSRNYLGFRLVLAP